MLYDVMMCAYIPRLAELQQVKSTSNNQQTANGSMGLLILGVFFKWSVFRRAVWRSPGQTRR